MTQTTFIYCLTEPGTKTIRYFGKANCPKTRRTDHLNYAKTGKRMPVTCWITKLVNAGQRPDMHVLLEVPQENWEIYERAFIAVGRQNGLDLLNLTDGGDGSSSGERNHNFGKKYSPERCAAMSAAMKGRTAWNKGRKMPETSGVNHHTFGKTFSAETIAKMSAAAKGRPAWNRGQKTNAATLEKLSVIRTRSKRANSTSKFIGVYWDKTWPGWVVRIRVGGKYIFVGNSKNEIEAAKMSDAAAINYFGPNTKLNFPNGQQISS